MILVANLQRETGGNTAEVLDQVAETVRERGELRRLVASLTAQGRMSRWIVTALPILLLVLRERDQPHLHGAACSRPRRGRLALALAGTLLLAGSLVIKRIVDIRGVRGIAMVLTLIVGLALRRRRRRHSLSRAVAMPRIAAASRIGEIEAYGFAGTPTARRGEREPAAVASTASPTPSAGRWPPARAASRRPRSAPS